MQGFRPADAALSVFLKFRARMDYRHGVALTELSARKQSSWLASGACLPDFYPQKPGGPYAGADRHSRGIKSQYFEQEQAVLYALGVVVFILLVVVARTQFRSQNAHANAGSPHPFPAGQGEAAPAVLSAGPSSKAQFDPDATRIYAQPPGLASPGALKREVALPINLDKARLVCLSGSLKGKQFPISRTGLFVGRGPDCDIVLDDNRVSSHHAWIGVIKGKLELHDLHSTNGTYINEHTDTSVTEVELRASDTIFFGGHKAHQFRFVAD